VALGRPNSEMACPETVELSVRGMLSVLMMVYIVGGVGSNLVERALMKATQPGHDAPVALKERHEKITQGEPRSRGLTEICVEMGFI
jgi:hypothetical protein